ncbi:MAG: hypothetical protein Q8M94_01230, partial [Ignavibacteria bacterium]|nr:hypothetical protein [Ignavibacteria bacterium]
MRINTKIIDERPDSFEMRHGYVQPDHNIEQKRSQELLPNYSTISSNPELVTTRARIPIFI